MKKGISGVGDVTITTTTHFIPPIQKLQSIREKMNEIKIKGYQLLEITKKLTSSGSWFK